MRKISTVLFTLAWLCITSGVGVSAETRTATNEQAYVASLDGVPYESRGEIIEAGYTGCSWLRTGRYDRASLIVRGNGDAPEWPDGAVTTVVDSLIMYLCPSQG